MDKTTPSFNFTPSRLILLLTLALVSGLMIWGLAAVLPPSVDWSTAFRPAALKLISGRSPYEIEGFFNPFWALIPLIPIAILPEQIGRAVLLVVSIIGYAYITRKLGGGMTAVILILLSPPALHGLLNGNIDWLTTLGVVLPPPIGIFFVATKPQIGAAIIVFWVIEAWRDGGWRKVARLIGPITIVFLLTLLIFGPWPLRSAKEIDLWWNASLWPMSIPVGLALLVAAVRTRKINFSMGAAPCLSPYILLHSWIIALFAIVTRLPELGAAVIGLWILVIIQAMS